MAEPTLVFVFDMNQWFSQISPLTKLELLDDMPQLCTQFFLDKGMNAYVMTLTKSTWDAFSIERKTKFKVLTRQLREEVEGPMSQLQREEYEKADLFELYAQRKPEPEPEAEFAKAALVESGVV